MPKQRRGKRDSKSYHGPEHWDDVLEREFKGESDRACVILGSAVLDSALEILLKGFFLPSATADDPLFDGANACLATFSSRIEMAARLGLIDSAFAKNLHLVRRIRNDFAHNIAGCTFTDSAVLSRLTELRRSSGLPENALDARPNFPEGPRGDFQMVVSAMQWLLRAYAEHVKPLSDTRSLSGHWSADRKQKRKKAASPANNH